MRTDILIKLVDGLGDGTSVLLCVSGDDLSELIMASCLSPALACRLADRQAATPNGFPTHGRHPLLTSSMLSTDVGGSRGAAGVLASKAACGEFTVACYRCACVASQQDL